MTGTTVFTLLGKIAIDGVDETKKELNDVAESGENTKNKLSDSFQSIGNKAADLGKKMTLGLTTAIGGLVGMGVKYNIEMETLETNLATLLGSSEKASAKLEELRTMGAKTPFETTDLVKATQKMLAFGIDTEKTNGYLQMLGDISMGDANKLDSLTLAFSQIGASGRASMEDINQMIDQGFNPLTYVVKNTGESMAEVRDRVSEGKVSFEEIASAMQDATSKGGSFYGSMDKASETTSGKISTLKDNLGVMVGNLTNSLMPIFEKIVNKLAEWVEWFSSLDSGTQEMIVKTLLLVAAIGPLLIILGNIISSVGTMITVFGKLKTAFTVVKTSMSALNVVMKANPIGLVITAIGLLVAAFIYLWNNCEGFRNFWIKLGNKIKEVWNSAVNGVKKGIENVKNFFGNLKDNVTSKIKSFKDGVVNTFNKIRTAITSPIEKARDVVKGVIDKIKGFFKFNVSLPKIKLPHFAIKPSGWQIGDLLKGSIPKLGIDWYAKAVKAPMLLDEPTAFGISNSGNIRVGGEAGSEIVGGTSTIMGMISNAVSSNNGGMEDKLDRLINLLNNYLPALSNQQVVLSTGELVGAMVNPMDRALGQLADDRRRGR